MYFIYNFFSKTNGLFSDRIINSYLEFVFKASTLMSWETAVKNSAQKTPTLIVFLVEQFVSHPHVFQLHPGLFENKIGPVAQTVMCYTTLILDLNENRFRPVF